MQQTIEQQTIEQQRRRRLDEDSENDLKYLIEDEEMRHACGAYEASDALVKEMTQFEADYVKKVICQPGIKLHLLKAMRGDLFASTLSINIIEEMAINFAHSNPGKKLIYSKKFARAREITKERIINSIDNTIRFHIERREQVLAMKKEKRSFVSKQLSSGQPSFGFFRTEKNQYTNDYGVEEIALVSLISEHIAPHLIVPTNEILSLLEKTLEMMITLAMESEFVKFKNVQNIMKTIFRHSILTRNINMFKKMHAIATSRLDEFSLHRFNEKFGKTIFADNIEALYRFETEQEKQQLLHLIEESESGLITSGSIHVKNNTITMKTQQQPKIIASGSIYVKNGEVVATFNSH